MERETIKHTKTELKEVEKNPQNFIYLLYTSICKPLSDIFLIGFRTLYLKAIGTTLLFSKRLSESLIGNELSANS